MKLLKPSTFIFLLVSIFFSTEAQQLTFGPKLALGAASGMRANKAAIGEDGHTIHFPIISFSGGMFLAYKDSSGFGFSVEPGYIRKGSAFKNYSPDNFVHLDYINLPMLIHKTVKGKVSLCAGAEYAFLFGGWVQNFNENSSINNFAYEKHDLSVMIGTDVALKENLVCGLRVCHALLPVTRLQYDQNIASDYNRYAILQFMYKLN